MSAWSFWLPAEAAQAGYKMLRARLLGHGLLLDDLTTAPFGRRGLVGLIAWPAAEPVSDGETLGAARPAWSPHADDRISDLAAGYQFLLEVAAAPRYRPATAEGRRESGRN